MPNVLTSTRNGAATSAFAVHVASRRWLNLFHQAKFYVSRFYN
jgi:hypothetical protein